MRTTYAVTIADPLDEVWRAVVETDFQRRWQVTLQSIEHVSGSPGSASWRGTATARAGRWSCAIAVPGFRPPGRSGPEPAGHKIVFRMLHG